MCFSELFIILLHYWIIWYRIIWKPIIKNDNDACPYSDNKKRRALIIKKEIPRREAPFAKVLTRHSNGSFGCSVGTLLFKPNNIVSFLYSQKKKKKRPALSQREFVWCSSPLFYLNNNYTLEIDGGCCFKKRRGKNHTLFLSSLFWFWIGWQTASMWNNRVWK